MSRYYGDSYELISEVYRDLDEMGIIVKPKSYQNKDISNDENYWTKEIQNYMYTLVKLGDTSPLFLFEDTKEWCTEEFIERVTSRHINPGTAWTLRPETWTQFMDQFGTFDYTYNERINYMSNLKRVIWQLQHDPDSRQVWLPIFHPTDLQYFGGKKRIPCSLGYFFMVREGKLNLTYIQRSADAVTHFGNDIYLAWKMMEYVARKIGVEPGMMTHHIFSLHAYKKDWEILNKGIHELIEH